MCGKTANVADLNSSSVGGRAGRKNCFIVRRRSRSPAWNTIGVLHFEILSKIFKNPRFSSTFVISSSICLILKYKLIQTRFYLDNVTWMIGYLGMIWLLWEQILSVRSWHSQNDICQNILVSNIQKCVFERNNCILEEIFLLYRHSTFRQFFDNIRPKVLKNVYLCISIKLITIDINPFPWKSIKHQSGDPDRFLTMCPKLIIKIIISGEVATGHHVANLPMLYKITTSTQNVIKKLNSQKLPKLKNGSFTNDNGFWINRMQKCSTQYWITSIICSKRKSQSPWHCSCYRYIRKHFPTTSKCSFEMEINAALLLYVAY